MFNSNARKKNAAIMLAATNNSAFAIANVIIGLERYSSEFYDSIYIYHDGFSQSDMVALSKLSEKIKFVLYTNETFLNKCNFKGTIPASFGRYTHMSVCRYELFNYLNDYKYGVWIDFDILIQKDISFLTEYAPWGMIKTVNPIKNAINGSLEGITGNEICLSSGVMIISDDIKNHEKITNELYEKTSKYSEILLLPDQAILNYISYLHNNGAKAIPDKLISPPEWKVSLNDAPMIHAAGSKKRFWNEASLIVAFPEWHLNNKIWLSKGGSDFKGEIFNKYKIPYPLSAGFFVQKSRIISLKNEIINSPGKTEGLYCSNDVWSDSIIITSTLYKSESCKISVTLNNHATVKLHGKIKSNIFSKSIREIKIPISIQISEHIDLGIIEIKGTLKDGEVLGFLHSISQAMQS